MERPGYQGLWHRSLHYQMPDVQHARNAKARASAAYQRGYLTKTQRDQIYRKADAIIRRCRAELGIAPRPLAVAANPYNCGDNPCGGYHDNPYYPPGGYWANPSCDNPEGCENPYDYEDDYEDYEEWDDNPLEGRWVPGGSHYYRGRLYRGGGRREEFYPGGGYHWGGEYHPGGGTWANPERWAPGGSHYYKGRLYRGGGRREDFYPGGGYHWGGEYHPGGGTWANPWWGGEDEGEWVSVSDVRAGPNPCHNPRTAQVISWWVDSQGKIYSAGETDQTRQPYYGKFYRTVNSRPVVYIGDWHWSALRPKGWATKGKRGKHRPRMQEGPWSPQFQAAVNRAAGEAALRARTRFTHGRRGTTIMAEPHPRYEKSYAYMPNPVPYISRW
jgi:hypothetical protein